ALEYRRRLVGVFSGMMSVIVGVHLLIGGHLNYSPWPWWEDEFTGRLLLFNSWPCSLEIRLFSLGFSWLRGDSQLKSDLGSCLKLAFPRTVPVREMFDHLLFCPVSDSAVSVAGKSR
ncbi:hypothetical protein, partial [Microbulbifer sp.]|uniref:hypothetical protein n=1 Tax=Microbulbifer sp. TaxID=1908541 RepID=UPI003F2BFEE5